MAGFDPNQPRDEIGQWTEAESAARKAAGLSTLDDADIEKQIEAYEAYYSEGNQEPLKEYFESPAGKEQIKEAQEHARTLSKNGKTVRLYRGVNGAKTFRGVPGRYQSWSLNPDTAWKFASGELNSTRPAKGFGALFVAEVPIEYVHATFESFDPFRDDSPTGGLQEFFIEIGKFKIEIDELYEEEQD